MSHVRIRVLEEDTWLDVVIRAVAVVAAGARATLSHTPGTHDELMEILEEITHPWAGDMEFLEETDEELVQALERGQVDRLRYSGRSEVAAAVRAAAQDQFVYVADSAVSLLGRIELLWYVREQSVCVDYHRYGNLGFRAEEVRQSVM